MCASDVDLVEWCWSQYYSTSLYDGRITITIVIKMTYGIDNTVNRYPSFEDHLNPEHNPKRILSLDGGGLRGFISIGILRDIERILRERHNNDPDFRLGHYFDLIAGTSTGAIISAGLSLGMTVDEIHGHYMDLGSFLFKRSLLRKGFFRAKYDAEAVREGLISVFGDRRLDSDDFLTSLLIVTKRLDTGSMWPLTNNPKSRYFSGGTNSTTIPNGHYPLWQVVRASTAAPHFFDPEIIQIGKGESGLKSVAGDFVDGGVSPANNPALQALMTSTMDGYCFNWSTGEDKLLVVSVGTGMANVEVGRAGIFKSRAMIHAMLALQGLMADCADQVESVMQWLSASHTARAIDREMGMATPPLGGTPMISYQRYNVHFETDWWAEIFGEQVSGKALKKLEAMDNAKNIPALDKVGQMAGRTLVKPEHFRSIFDLSL